MRFCHSLIHEIGHRAYEKYGDFGQAVAYRDEICNSGYLHGVIEWAFKDSPDVPTAMRTICEPYPFGKFLSWECYHGVGHGAMFSTANDLPGSVKLCEAYARRFARDSCLNGVYMENFNTSQQLHPSRYRDPNDLFFPCNLPDTTHKSDCYLYAPTYFLSFHPNDYASALEWCTTAERGFAQTCAAGVGSEAIKENLNDPKMVEATCLAAPAGLQGSCLAGLVDLYILHHGALEPARALCGQLEDVSRPICEQVVNSEADLF